VKAIELQPKSTHIAMQKWAYCDAKVGKNCKKRLIRTMDFTNLGIFSLIFGVSFLCFASWD